MIHATVWSPLAWSVSMCVFFFFFVFFFCVQPFPNVNSPQINTLQVANNSRRGRFFFCQ